MILTGDCVELMATLDADSVDAIVTDPPYGLEFMGKEWDRLGAGTELVSEGMDASHPFRDGTRRVRYGQDARTMQAWHTLWAREAFRIAKPGAHLLAFGGSRTYHRLASAIEDAGWEIRDCLVWAYASGFPKSLDVSKAIDKAAGAEREVVGRKTDPRYQYASDKGFDKYSEQAKGYDDGTTLGKWTDQGVMDTAPATDAAKRWSGWGTALKPAWEPIVMARKPLRGTVAANVLAYGTGALNIDGTRIPGLEAQTYTVKRLNPGASVNATGEWKQDVEYNGQTKAGRWPANVVLTDPIFDGGVDGVVGGGTTTSSEWPTRSRDGHDAIVLPEGTIHDAYLGGGYGDTGTYSRFFLIPKAARSDREPVLRGQLEADQYGGEGHALRGERNGVSRDNRARENLHPTVKPVELMRHLVRLVTPPGGTVLDCFLGSGSTAIAAELEGFAWIGIEKEAEYVAIAEARLNGTQRGLGL